MRSRRQERSNTFLCHLTGRRFVLRKLATWSDMRSRRLRIVCNAEDVQRSTRSWMYCVCGRFLQGTTDDVQMQAKHRIRSRFIMYVPGIHDSALNNTQCGRRHGKSEESRKLTGAKDSLDSVHKHNVRNDRESAASLTSNIENACTNKDNDRSPTWKTVDSS